MLTPEREEEMRELLAEVNRMKEVLKASEFVRRYTYGEFLKSEKEVQRLETFIRDDLTDDARKNIELLKDNAVLRARVAKLRHALELALQLIKKHQAIKALAEDEGAE
jgi:hypothetical protein